MYTGSQIHIAIFFELLPTPRLPDERASLLESVFSEAEVYGTFTTLCSLVGDRTPGLNGLPLLVCQRA